MATYTVIDTSFRFHKIGSNNIAYFLSDMDETGGYPNYYGYINDTGGYVIEKHTATSIRYAIAKENYTTDWTGKANLTYKYFYQWFE